MQDSWFQIQTKTTFVIENIQLRNTSFEAKVTYDEDGCGESKQKIRLRQTEHDSVDFIRHHLITFFVHRVNMLSDFKLQLNIQ